MNKNIFYASEGRNLMAAGVNKLANAVKVTLGAKGRNVIIGSDYRNPHITKDGVTVADAIHLEDVVENMGATLIKEVANKTVDMSGDGTTTATILSQYLINAGIVALDNKVNPIDLKIGMTKAVCEIVKSLKTLSKEVIDTNTLKNIASISANNDAFIGELIAKAVEIVGKDGLITTEKSMTHETYIEVVEGLKIDKGYASPHFVTNQEKMIAELINPKILLVEGKISNIKSLLPVLELIAKSNSPLLIIADEIDGEALATLVVNKLRGLLRVCSIESPDFGITRKNSMEDLAVLTGGTFITSEKGFSLETIDESMLGSAEKVTVSKNNCVILSGKGEKEAIETLASNLKKQLDSSETFYEKEVIKNRLSKIGNGVAVLKIGGVTDTEIGEKKDRIDDAICATQSALEEGFVAGGGVTYLEAAMTLRAITGVNHDEQRGIDIVLDALSVPFETILLNGGIDPFTIYPLFTKNNYGMGYNIKTNVWENLFDSGVIDSTKVLRVALENAVSISSIFLTTECVISLKNKKSEDEN
jgi:chaperonin GroEL